jgi:HEAT repeat protein
MTDSSIEVEDLIRKLGATEVEVRRAAVSKLEKIAANPIVVEAFAKYLDDPDYGVRLSAIQALTEVRDQRAIEPLKLLLQDSQPWIRIKAAELLCYFGIFEPLIASLGDESSQVKHLAIMNLNISVRDPEHLPKLIELLVATLCDENSDVRSMAMFALHNSRSPELVEKLLEKLNHSNTVLQSNVIEALGWIGDKAAIEPLLEIVNHEDDKLRQIVRDALLKLGHKFEP